MFSGSDDDLGMEDEEEDDSEPDLRLLQVIYEYYKNAYIASLGEWEQSHCSIIYSSGNSHLCSYSTPSFLDCFTQIYIHTYGILESMINIYTKMTNAQS